MSMDTLVAYLTKTLPESAHEKIPEVIGHIEARISDEVENEIASSPPPPAIVIDFDLEVAGTPSRATVEVVNAYGLRIELDAAGLATLVHSDRGFIA